MRCAVLGDPIAHSLSPVLHRAGYDAVGLDWTYEAHRVAEGGLADFVATLDEAWCGLSLTMPLKREALDLADRVSDAARLAGAANTLLLVDGAVHVDNTDLPGAVSAIRERFESSVTSASILGAGATAASTGLALAELGVTTLQVHARNAERAAPTVAAIGAHPTAPEVTVRGLAEATTGEVVVSTVPAGAQDAATVERTAGAAVVFEVIYDPWPTPLAAAATQRGQVLVTGLDLLVHQAALQFTAFTGHAAPLAEMRAAGEAALVARST
ncbi:shikimate dehydrogenase [Nocardioides panacisoli]|uniref:shikimate dehydrogenase n=1 Tax=Nocardioides panacisoli TaxID=627624 RepID=UPI001C630AE5|nr:shikimate dehydrogenase [Nocardioides panacisoli]QYJ05204.1 shikimate dehydrogenase [Nocardioides panacisoli]